MLDILLAYPLRIYFLLLFILPLLGFSQSEKEVNTFLKKLVKYDYITSEEAKKVDQQDVLASIYDVYLERYGLKRGSQGRGFQSMTILLAYSAVMP